MNRYGQYLLLSLIRNRLYIFIFHFLLLILIFIILLININTSVAAISEFNINKIDTIVENGVSRDLFGSYPDINDLGQVVFYSLESNGDTIFIYNNGKTVKITNDNNQNTMPEINNSCQIIWKVDSHDWKTDYGYYIYDGRIFQLVDGSHSAINHDFGDLRNIVWMDSDNQIYLCSKDGIKQISSNSYINYPPQINNRGEAVWVGYPTNAYFPEIYKYVKGNTTIINKGTSVLHSYPKINNDGKIFFVGDDLTNRRIYESYNDNTVSIVNLQLGTFDYVSAMEVNDLGEIVYVVSYNQDSYSEIYFYSNGINSKIYETNHYPTHIQVNNLSQVVWEMYDGNDSEIYFYHDDTVTQLTNNSYMDINPRLNNLGQIVWEADCQYPQKPGIYLASPKSGDVAAKVYGLFIGVRKKGENISLRGDLDAQNVRKAFVNNINNMEEKILTGDADGAGIQLNEIISAINEIKGKIRFEDAFVLYISSHGGSYYTGTETTVNPGDEFCRLGLNSDLTDDNLYSYLNDMKGTKLVILDSCHSRGFWGNYNSNDSGDLEKVLNPIALIAAANEDKISFFDENGLSYLQHLIVFAFNKNPITKSNFADLNQDGIVNFEELAVFVKLFNFIPLFDIVYEKELGDPVQFTVDMWNPTSNKKGDLRGLKTIKDITPVINLLLLN